MKKAIGKGTPKVTPTTKGFITNGCHLVRVKSIELARTSTGQVLHTATGEIAMEVTFENRQGHTISIVLWTTDSALWVMQNFLKAFGIGYNPDNQMPRSKVLGKFLYICVSAIHDRRGKEIDPNPSKYFVLPNQMLPYVKGGGAPRMKGDPCRGENPRGTMFMTFNDIPESVKATDDDWFN